MEELERHDVTAERKVSIKVVTKGAAHTVDESLSKQTNTLIVSKKSFTKLTTAPKGKNLVVKGKKLRKGVI